MLTRAKSLEIVVGNPETLKKDPFWNAFVEYCEDNRCVVASKRFESLMADLSNLRIYDL